jgi:hypothetical protein
MFAVPL